MQEFAFIAESRTAYSLCLGTSLIRFDDSSPGETVGERPFLDLDRPALSTILDVKTVSLGWDEF